MTKSAEYSRTYRERHPDRLAESQKRYRETHDTAKQKREWLAKNPDKATQYAANYEERHPNARKEIQARYRENHDLAEYSKQWRADNPGKAAAYSKKWKDTHPAEAEKNKARLRALAKDRKENGLCTYCGEPRMPNSGAFCEKHWFYTTGYARLHDPKAGPVLRQKLIDQNYTDPYTGEQLVPGINCCLDHILPASRFPELAGDVNNTEWVSANTNVLKHDLTRDEFIQLCRTIAARNA
jgi:hypothetical protein